MQILVRLRRWEHPAARAMAGWVACAVLCLSANATAANKVKLHGYVTSRADSSGAVMILDDRIEFTSASRVSAKDGEGEHPMKAEDLAAGMLRRSRRTPPRLPPEKPVS